MTQSNEEPQLVELIPLGIEALGFFGGVLVAALGAWGLWQSARVKGRAETTAAKAQAEAAVAQARAEAEASLKAALAQAEMERERTLLDGLAERVKHLEERVERLEAENRELELENASLRSTKLTLEEALQSSIEMIKAWEAFEASGFSTPPGRPSPGWPIRPYLGPRTGAIQKVAEASEKLQEVLDE